MALVHLSVLYNVPYKKFCFANTCSHMSTVFEIGGALHTWKNRKKGQMFFTF